MPNPDLPYSPACERNKDPILRVLRNWLPGTGTVLEIGSGTGQHIVHFAHQLPGMTWQPSDLAANLPGLKARLAQAGGINILAPIELDVSADQWPAGPFAAAYSANTAHIMPWFQVQRMLAGVARVLAPGGYFFLYGPFHEAGRHTAPSNEAFDLCLRAEDPAQGVRDSLEVRKSAAECDLVFEADIEMPANNQILIFGQPA